MPIMQSNSLRGEFMRNVVDTAVREILADIQCMFGPGASDAFITKNDQIYYTRDGKEVMESLMFDNELANKVHHILYQAAYHQGKNVGDGSTTLMVLYCNLYFRMRKALDSGEIKAPINVVRSRWKVIMDALIEKIKATTVPLTPDTMLSMFYTCTQDPELSAKIFSTLKDAIMAGAHIVPRKSNIATDFNVTTYNRPTVRVTRQFSLRPVKDINPNTVVLYCNGTLDMAHPEVLAAMATQMSMIGDRRIDMTYIILCHGITAATRSTIREFTRIIHRNAWDVNSMNNLAIYTMDDAMKMDKEELEDISTIITEDVGIGTLVNSITFEHLLYNVFNVKEFNNDTAIEDLENYDADPHSIDQMRMMCAAPYEVMFDAVDGMAIGKELGPVATERYKNLCQEAEVEKSAIRKASLESRIRKSYGMFIDIEVGSSLLKDSQRKFELILDAIISGSTAAQEDILIGNSVLHALRQAHRLDGFNREIDRNLIKVITDALLDTMVALVGNCYALDEKFSCETMLQRAKDDSYSISDFTLRDGPEQIWPRADEAPIIEPVDAAFTSPDGSDQILQICPRVVEPFGSISAILTNSILPIEIAMTKVFHLSGKTGFMSNYINAEG
ncbi:MAG: TCP-1/cpn60 chaperonin family protein [Muribaculaceae bacterium]|nr:TCP-1/cpn60 chaperonin family protein [Muribaculaceae bacterium]